MIGTSISVMGISPVYSTYQVPLDAVFGPKAPLAAGFFESIGNQLPDLERGVVASTGTTLILNPGILIHDSGRPRRYQEIDSLFSSVIRGLREYYGDANEPAQVAINAVAGSLMLIFNCLPEEMGRPMADPNTFLHLRGSSDDEIGIPTATPPSPSLLGTDYFFTGHMVKVPKVVEMQRGLEIEMGLALLLEIAKDPEARQPFSLKANPNDSRNWTLTLGSRYVNLRHRLAVGALPTGKLLRVVADQSSGGYQVTNTGIKEGLIVRKPQMDGASELLKRGRFTVMPQGSLVTYRQYWGLARLNFFVSP